MKKFYFLFKYASYRVLLKFPMTNKSKCLASASKYYGKLKSFSSKRKILNMPIEDNAVLIAQFESMGDIIACEPIIRKIKEEEPNRPVYWIIAKQYGDIVRYHPNLKGIIEINSVEQWIELKKRLPKTVRIIDLHFHRRKYILDGGKVYLNDNRDDINEENYFSMGSSLLEIFSKTAGLEPINTAPVFYRRPKIQQSKWVGGKYIVIHTVSAMWRKDYLVEKWEELIEKLSVIAKDIKIVEVGLLPSIKKKFPNYIDKTNLPSIQDTADIVAGSCGFIGIDSSIAHLANALNIKGVVLLGGSMPFSGNYQKGIMSKIIYPKDGIVRNISVETIINALKELQIL
ncbi:MAG: glycosyltransferase family 9 protein [Endomicrobium sp.]|jgi:heptosyltransferase-3|nr:glycosyltransferase family 9 protein [Endomicrobium sp.]